MVWYMEWNNEFGRKFDDFLLVPIGVTRPIYYSSQVGNKLIGNVTTKGKWIFVQPCLPMGKMIFSIRGKMIFYISVFFIFFI